LYYYKTLDIKANIPNVYRNLTSIYFYQKNYQKAVDVNKQFMDISKDVKEPLINIAKAYFISEQFDSAAVYFKEIIKLDPADSDAIKALIELYSKTNNRKEADYYNNLLFSSSHP